jgi:hypothetical protein
MSSTKRKGEVPEEGQQPATKKTTDEKIKTITKIKELIQVGMSK